MSLLIKKWLGDSPFWKNVLRLALPIAFQNLLASTFGMVDTIMIGRLGDIELAAVGMANNLPWLLHLLMFGISSGAAVMISQFWGVRDNANIRRSYGLMLINSLVVSLIFACIALFFPEMVLRMFTDSSQAINVGAGYLRNVALSFIGIALNSTFSTVLRSTENVKLPMVASGITVVLNIFLNWVFIFGNLGVSAMGVNGAAIATSISALATPLILLAISFAKKNHIIAPVKELLTVSKEFAVKFYKLCMPVLFNEGLWALGTIGYNMVYGRMGTECYSALTIFRTIESIAFVFFVGICHSCSIMVGKSIGAGFIKDGIRDSRRFFALMPLVSLVVGLTMIALRYPILSIFNIEETTHRLARGLMVIYGLYIPIRNLPYITIVGIFRAGGDTRTGLIYDICCVWLIALPATIFAGLVLKLDFLTVYVIMVMSEDIVKNILCLRHFISLKWIKPVTEEGKRAFAEM